ncbi:MAG: hypothetical protein WAL49_11540 [Pseudolabrys sp.]
MPDRNVMFGLIALIAIGFVALIVGGALQEAESKDMAGGSLQLYESLPAGVHCCSVFRVRSGTAMVWIV